DRGVAVEHAAAAVTDDVAAHQLGVDLVVDLVHQFTVQGGVADQFVELFHRHGLLHVQAHDRQRTVRRGHPHGVGCELVLQAGDGLGHRAAGTGAGDHHVDGGTAAPARFL